ncbi:glycosyltransferase family 87 protein [Mucilaginibacter terrae]|uniref:glycosyltransferase family 87 protein n=1 Tax=Mucilaginibacter terrae TaxID=1955052 RepID=UPI00363D70CF
MRKGDHTNKKNNTKPKVYFLCQIIYVDANGVAKALNTYLSEVLLRNLKLMRFNKTYLNIFLVVVSAVFAVMSYNRGMRADVNGDYHIYWETGKHFLSGEKIYTPGLLDGGFTYPPFAALFFSLFSVFPFPVSAFLFGFLVNFGLWIVSFILVKNIFAVLYPNEDITLPITLALLLSIAFYWHNYIWMNANMPVLCLTLLGILFYLHKQFTVSYLFLMAATFFKITPILFLFFAAVKRGPKDWPKIILTALPFIIIPAVLRGLTTGINDWKDYYEAFVAPFSKGQIDENIISLGIPALLNKINTGNAEVGIAPIMHLQIATLKLIILAFQLLVMGALTAKFIYDRYVKKIEGFSAADICLIFMIPLLLPGRVWAHHHVCTGFIYTYVFFILLKQKRVVLLVTTCFLCLLANGITKGAIGQTLTDLLKHYAYVTLLMLYVSWLILLLGYREKHYKLAKN